MFSGFSNDSKVPIGNLAKASSVGANTVNGPALLSVLTRSAACTALTSVVNEPASTATSTMSFFEPAKVKVALKATKIMNEYSLFISPPYRLMFNCIYNPRRKT